MSVKVSAKYQVVIPKAVRRQLGIKPGQKFTVTAGADGSVVLDKAGRDTATDIDAWMDKYAGILKTGETAWGKQGLDPTDWIRKQRDEEWD